MSTYASYNSLYNECAITPKFTAYTDSTRFNCPSIPEQSSVQRSLTDTQPSRTKIDCLHNCEKKSDTTCEYKETFKDNFKEDENLLPVMDPTFNMREICKQCILLEDHLSHPEKRCYDCCIKHFLTIEALAEEAITLDSKQKQYRQIQTLPSMIRNLQKMWHSNPHSNANKVAQGLRQIRKQYQIDSFQVVFNNQQCENGVCKIRY